MKISNIKTAGIFNIVLLVIQTSSLIILQFQQHIIVGRQKEFQTHWINTEYR